MKLSFDILCLVLMMVSGLAVFLVYYIDEGANTPKKVMYRHCAMAGLACLAASFGLVAHLFYYSPEIFDTEPAVPAVSSQPEPMESTEPTELRPMEIPLVDYAEILRNSEEYGGQEVRVAGRISRLSDQSLIFEDRLGGEFDREFDINLYNLLPSGQSASDYYQQNQYVIVQGKWESWRKRLHGNAVFTGEMARQEAQVFMDAWEAEGRGYADALPITDYMDVAASPEDYDGQRIRTAGKIYAPAEKSYYKSVSFYFLNRADGNTKCIELNLQGCPPEMQGSCQEGEYVVLSGVVCARKIGDPYLRECFVENTGVKARELAEQSEAAWWERLTAEREAYLASCQEYAYDELARYPDKYKGERIVLTGTVAQTRLDNLDDHVLLDVGGGHMVYVSYYGKFCNDPEILEGDRVTFYGRCSGRMSYSTPQNETKTAPWVVADYSSFNRFDVP